MSRLPDDEVVKVVDAINVFDREGDGRIELGKVIDCLRSLGLNPVSSEVTKILQDTKMYGRRDRIDLEVFLPIYEHFRHKQKPNYHHVCDDLKALDTQDLATGYVGAKQLREALIKVGDKLTKRQASEILDPLTDHHGQVNIDELVRLVMGDPQDQDDDIHQQRRRGTYKGSRALPPSGMQKVSMTEGIPSGSRELSVRRDEGKGSVKPTKHALLDIKSTKLHGLRCKIQIQSYIKKLRLQSF